LITSNPKRDIINKKITLYDIFTISKWRIGRIFKPTTLPSEMTDKVYPSVAFCTIAMGESYHYMSLTMLQSLRKNGGFSGPVYVFTDLPDFYKDLDNIHPIKVPIPRSVMAAHQYKTLILENIRDEHIAYIDADIIIGKPLDNWLQKAIKESANHPIVLFWDHGSTGHFYHGGLFLVSRRVARSLLTRWRHLIWFGRYSRDQKALIKAIKRKNDVYIMPKDDMVFVGQSQASTDMIGTFNHITGRARKTIPAEKIKDLARQLGLEEYL